MPELRDWWAAIPSFQLLQRKICGGGFNHIKKYNIHNKIWLEIVIKRAEVKISSHTPPEKHAKLGTWATPFKDVSRKYDSQTLIYYYLMWLKELWCHAWRGKWRSKDKKFTTDRIAKKNNHDSKKAGNQMKTSARTI